MDPKDWKFPMACPRCTSATGNPIRVSTDHYKLTVELRCGDCSHQWKLSEPSPSLFLRARADRRKSFRSR